MHEVHILGSIQGYSDFSEGDVGLQCSYKIHTSHAPKQPAAANNHHSSSSPIWIKLNGNPSGTTQLHYSPDSSMSSGTWNHPIDIQYATTGILGWPQIQFEIWSEDKWRRRSFVGYGSHYPLLLTTTPGGKNQNEVDVVIWRPCDTFFDNVRAYFMGGRRVGEFVACQGENESVGVLHLKLDVLVTTL